MSEKTIQPVMLADALAIDGAHPSAPGRCHPSPLGIHWFDEKEIDARLPGDPGPHPLPVLRPRRAAHVRQAGGEVPRAVWRNHALAVSSGTEAIYISLAAIDVGPGDEVLIPGYLWTSCLNGIVRLGAIPRLVDIDETFDMSPADLERKIGPHSKAVIYVHMSGAAATSADRRHRAAAQPHGARGLRPGQRGHAERPARRHVRRHRHLQLPAEQEHHRGRGRDDPLQR